MNLHDKIVLAHKGFFNKECSKLYRENSMDVCKVSTTKDFISIIELDIRKSKDGTLYCFHGSFVEYYFDLRFKKNFSIIKEKYNVDSLSDILDVITEDKIIFLDIKDRNVNKEDILNAFNGRKIREVILANKSVSFLNRFNTMPMGFVKMLNGNIFCEFYDMKKLADDNFKYFEVVFPFQISKKLLDRVLACDMQFLCSGLFFFNRKQCQDTTDRWGIKYISSDFI